MRKLAAPLLCVALLCSSDVFARSCPQVTYPTDAKIEISSQAWAQDHDELLTYQVSLPSELLGEPLRELNLWVTSDKWGADFDLIAPLAFDVNEGIATAEFVARREWMHLSITALYGEDEYCGPRLLTEGCCPRRCPYFIRLSPDHNGHPFPGIEVGESSLKFALRFTAFRFGFRKPARRISATLKCPWTSLS